MNDHRAILQASRRFTRKDDRLALVNLAATLAIHLAAVVGALTLAGQSLLALPLAAVAGVAGIRLYVLQHDYGHYSSFSTRRANELAGQLASVFTLAPFRAMQYNHNLHHAGVGSLDHRETGEVYTMTRAEWDAAGPLTRLAYRVYRNPFVMLGIGAFAIFVVRYRWPKNARRTGTAELMAHNAAVLAYMAGIVAIFGWQGLAVFSGIVFLAGILGSFLVYMQHNFEDTYWEHMPEREYHDAVLQGSSALDLGRWFDIATANINWHDLHHLNPQIPSYRLRQCHAALREEGVLEARLIGWREALASLRLKLWDEEAKRLVPFPPAPSRSRARAGVPA